MQSLPVNFDEIELTGYYKGWTFKIRTNPPLRVLRDIASGDLTLLGEGLASIIESWNFVDENGVLMPEPSADAIMELPSDLINAISAAYMEALSVLSPN